MYGLLNIYLSIDLRFIMILEAPIKQEGFEFLDEKYIYESNIYDIYLQERGFGTGLYLLRKKEG
jgi:hypothetical protein